MATDAARKPWDSKFLGACRMRLSQAAYASDQRGSENRHESHREDGGEHFRSVATRQMRLNNSHLMPSISSYASGALAVRLVIG
jgi:hypothetical protein